MSAKRLLAHDPSLLTEAEWSGLVVELARLGGFTLRYHTFTSKRSAYGFPDWVFCHPGKGRLVFVELKSEAGKPRPEQTAWLEALNVVPGVEAYLWRPSDWDEAVETLTGKRPVRAAA